MKKFSTLEQWCHWLEKGFPWYKRMSFYCIKLRKPLKKGDVVKYSAFIKANKPKNVRLVIHDGRKRFYSKWNRCVGWVQLKLKKRLKTDKIKVGVQYGEGSEILIDEERLTLNEANH